MSRNIRRKVVRATINLIAANYDKLRAEFGMNEDIFHDTILLVSSERVEEKDLFSYFKWRLNVVTYQYTHDHYKELRYADYLQAKAEEESD